MNTDISCFVVSTGNAEIDNKMGGGIPIGSTTLIEGDSHAGKSILTQQMMWGSLHDRFRTSLITAENTVKSLVRQMQSLNLDVTDFLLLRRLRVFPMEVARAENDVLDELLAAVRQEGVSGSDIVFIDALTPCISVVTEKEVLAFFEGCKRFCSDGMTIVTVIHSHAVDQELLVRITSLCDAHLHLRTEVAGDRLVKTMEVAKIKGASRSTGSIVSFDVEPGLGMRVIPISKAQA